MSNNTVRGAPFEFFFIFGLAARSHALLPYHSFMGRKTALYSTCAELHAFQRFQSEMLVAFSQFHFPFPFQILHTLWKKSRKRGYGKFKLTKPQSRRRENHPGYFPFQISPSEVDGRLLTRKECLKTIVLSSKNESHPNSGSNGISR